MKRLPVWETTWMTLVWDWRRIACVLVVSNKRKHHVDFGPDLVAAQVANLTGYFYYVLFSCRQKSRSYRTTYNIYF